MYIIKEKPEDFIVNEVSVIEPSKEGIFCYFLLKKKNYTTIRAIDYLTSYFRVSRKQIGYAGIKDKHAITSQYISVRKKRAGKDIELKDLSLTFLGYGDQPISLGDLKGNRFEIIVRNVNYEPKKISRFPNLFGEQRFSSQNPSIGKALVKKNFKLACDFMMNSEGEYENLIREHLGKDAADYIGALKKVPPKLLSLLVHSYQSFIWNETVKRLLEVQLSFDNLQIPLIGFDTQFGSDDVSNIILEIMQEEQITPRDFIIRQIPYLTFEGNSRSLYCQVEDLEIGQLLDDEIYQGKKKCKVAFFLQKGSYATVAIDFMMN